MIQGMVRGAPDNIGAATAQGNKVYDIIVNAVTELGSRTAPPLARGLIGGVAIDVQHAREPAGCAMGCRAMRSGA